MELEKIHPELRSATRRFPNFPAHNRALVSIANFALKLKPKAKSGKGVNIRIVRLGTAGARVYEPAENPSGAGLLWIHGGGMITGNAAINDDLCIKYANDLGLTVVSAEYRLAPKSPFPTPLDDCYSVWKWMLNEAGPLGIDPARIVISGQSAGGGLAASLVQRLSDEGGIQPVGQALFCPMLDDRTATDEALDAVNHRLWNNRANRAGWAAYLGHPPGADSEPPYAVPARRQDLSGLPPAWIGIGDIDLFHDESCAYSSRLSECGVESRLHIAPKAPHGFESFAPGTTVAKAMYQDNFQFLKDVLQLAERN